jgi:hypothetical protein
MGKCRGDLLGIRLLAEVYAALAYYFDHQVEIVKV